MIDMTIPDEMPEKWGKGSVPSLESIMKKYEYQKYMGMYAFISWKWIIPFAEWINGRKVLEIMAGAGWLARALREKNVDMIATDNKRWQIASAINGHRWPVASKIEKMSANKAIAEYGKWCDIMIISWPWMDDSAYYAIRLLNQVNPNALIVYIGENGGCTASSKFFEHFENIHDSLFERAANQYQSWRGIHDKLFLGKYSSSL